MGEVFYSNGLQFECQQSGQCCTSRDEYGFVYLTREDRKRLAEHLKLDVPAFIAEHCQTTDDQLHLRDPDRNCAFLDGKRCSVYDARPTQCRTWPFWPETMNAKTWNGELASTCAGIGKGRLWSREEINGLVQLANKSTRR
ncbi:MAG: YkgJ family cysteine cluster protein [Clostridia bacterium]|nr:YkgJ family cysteine cluster protein [Deltaproteobacteria bacterium]